MIDSVGFSVAALRRALLTVTVLTDLDVLPGDDGAVLDGVPPVPVGLPECRRALAGADPESAVGRDRLSCWLHARRWLAGRSHSELAQLARPVGVPADSPRHPGADWVRVRVLGSALDLGLGFVGLAPSRPDDVVVVAQGPLTAARVTGDDWWPAALAHLERMGESAAARLRRLPGEPLRPVGDCDVVTLLGARALRAALASTAQGLCPVAVPTRRAGWIHLSGIDSAFAVAAAAATHVEERGFARPLLVTADEVAQVPSGGRPARLVLGDPVLDRRPCAGPGCLTEPGRAGRI